MTFAQSNALITLAKALWAARVAAIDLRNLHLPPEAHVASEEVIDALKAISDDVRPDHSSGILCGLHDALTSTGIAPCVCGKPFGPGHQPVSAYGVWCCPERLFTGSVGNPASSATPDKSERDACAALAKEYAAELRDMGEPDEVALTIAAAIAARGES